MYALTAEEAEASTEVVAGICALVLFDFRASHSFVSKQFARKLDVPSRTLECKLVVSTPTGVVEQLKEVCGQCSVEIDGKTLDAQLIKFNINVYNVLYVSMLKRYIHDPSHVLPVEPEYLEADMTYEEQPVEILDHKIMTLRNRSIAFVKV
ncbi:uncharacterized protein LOC122076384 [Macadamia integrifolia]|uniref:uncharacterized protein LOC122076384 n=1 Tax=Macadamia integrifolia TaxID=60698 RepID=UPI001C4FCEE4|nr:uncharacterized protein LOC122076384 [Macadamia integrifolia]